MEVMGQRAVSTYMGLGLLFPRVYEIFAFGVVSGKVGLVCL